MERHIRILAVLHIIYAFIQLSGAYIAQFFAARAGLLFNNTFCCTWIARVGGYEIGHIMQAIILYILGLQVLTGLAGLAGGFGLLSKMNWARVLVLILGIIAILNPPFGTALGIYTLWVLLKPESKQVLAG